MKITALALIRKGYPVHVDTVGRELWLIFLSQKVNGRADTLAAMWRPNGTVKGTKFHIIGYTGSAFEDRFTVNLPRSCIVWETPSTITIPARRYNQLIDHPTFSRIYARDILMRDDLNLLYSYNFWGFEMAPDRHAPKNEPDMWVDIGRLWCGVNRVDFLEKLLEVVCEPPKIKTDESYNISIDEWAMGRDPVSDKTYASLVAGNASYWQTAWRNVFGDNAVIRTSDRWTVR